MESGSPQPRRKPDRKPAAIEAAREFGAMLRDHLFRLDTRPKGMEPLRWTAPEFATKLPSSHKTRQHASARSVEGWLAGDRLPDEATVTAMLRALFGSDPRDDAERRQALHAAWRKARDLETLTSEPPVAAGAIAVAAGELVGLKADGAEDDIAAAADPNVQAEHPGIIRAARDLLSMLSEPRRRNLLMGGDFADLAETAAGFLAVIDCGTEDIPKRIAPAYQYLVTLSYAHELNEAFRKNPSDGESLPLVIGSKLGLLMTLGAPWMRVFPYVQARDERLARFARRTADASASREMAALLEQRGDLEAEALKLLREMVKTAGGRGTQAGKALEHLVGTIINILLFGGAGTMSSTRQTTPALRARLRALFRENRPLIERIAAGETEAVRAALGHAADYAARAVDGTPLGRDDPWPPRLPFIRWREPLPGMPDSAWPDMVTLPAGVFTMGRPEGEEGADDERPQREVTVPRPFALGRTAVTFAMWDAARDAGADLREAKDQGWSRDQRPVIDVSWEDTQAYCAWLNARLGLRAGTYRLPSEAEWEYACRAGTVTPFSFGATISPQQANYDGNYTYGKGRKGTYRERTVPVEELPANAWGLHEMHGNVWEWCEDAHGPYPDHATNSRPLIHADSSLRVLRGGSWNIDPRSCRSASRGGFHPYCRLRDAGVRLARTLF